MQQCEAGRSQNILAVDDTRCMYLVGATSRNSVCVSILFPSSSALIALHFGLRLRLRTPSWSHGVEIVLYMPEEVCGESGDGVGAIRIHVIP